MSKIGRRTRRLGLAAMLCAVATAAPANDGLGLRRAADPNRVSLSGLSSGAAMAVQYAVAHSGSVEAVGAVAGPQWGCADGSLSRAVNACLCGRNPLRPTIETAQSLSAAGAIDGLVSGRPRSLNRSWLFQSPADETVAAASGRADADFLTAFIGAAARLDEGNAADGSNRAGHGILTPDGSAPCAAAGEETGFVRRCGADDNVGKMFHALFGAGAPYDPSHRAAPVPDSEVWTFDQQLLIDRVKASRPSLANDHLNPLWLWLPDQSSRRRNFDMAATGSIYVPPSCRATGSACRVHVALHGCKQDVRQFALTAGYNEWAERYRAIIVYPAISPDRPASAAICRLPALDGVVDAAWIEPNPNGCWDWWGYLDSASDKGRHLTKRAPQIRVLTGIIAEVTAPASD